MADTIGICDGDLAEKMPGATTSAFNRAAARDYALFANLDLAPAMLGLRTSTPGAP